MNSNECSLNLKSFLTGFIISVCFLESITTAQEISSGLLQESPPVFRQSVLRRMRRSSIDDRWTFQTEQQEKNTAHSQWVKKLLERNQVQVEDSVVVSTVGNTEEPVIESTVERNYEEYFREKREQLLHEKYQQDPSDYQTVLQSVHVNFMWLDQNGNNDLAISELETYMVFGFPFPTRDKPLLVTPGFTKKNFDGLVTPDVPSNVYDAYVQFRWLGKVNDRWGYDLAVMPGVHSDFQFSGSDTFRIQGHGFASYDWSQDLRLVFGVAYLDRPDVSVLPAVGLIWTPNRDWRFELIAPRPKIAWRFGEDVAFWHFHGVHDEKWLYLASEFGGGSWAVERANLTRDVVSLSDFRLALGIEWFGIYGKSQYEIGYVFGRTLEYENSGLEVDLVDTFFIRMKFSPFNYHYPGKFSAKR